MSIRNYFFSGERIDEVFKKAGLYLIFFLCVFIPFRSPLADLIFSSIKAIPDVLILIFFIFYSIRIKFRYKFILADWLYVAFLIIALFSTFINHVGLSAYIFEVRSISVYYILFFILRNFKYTRADFCKIVLLLQVVMFVLLAFGIVEKITDKEFLFSQNFANSIPYESNFVRVYSLFYNPNTYGTFLVLTFFLTLYKGLYCQQKNPIIVYIALLLSLLLCMPRSALIIFVIGACLVFFYQLYHYKNSINWKRIISAILIVGLSVGILYTGIRQANVAYVNSQDSSNNHSGSHIGIIDRFNDEKIITNSGKDGRIYTVVTGLKIFSDYPVIGTGFGTYGSAASMHQKPALFDRYDIPFPLYADNQYITILVETGIIGTFLFLAFLFSILWRYRKDLTKILFCFIIAWFGIFYNMMEVQIVSFLLWTFLSFENLDLCPPVKKINAKSIDTVSP